MFSLQKTLNEHYKLISITLSVLAAVLVVAGVVSATTIGTNISTAALTVTGATTINSIAYTWPGADGTNGQFLTTDGSGALSWSTASPSSGGGWTDDGTVVRLTGITDSVGVGTTSPAQKLSVQGNGLLSGDLSLAGLTATGTVKTTGSIGAGGTTTPAHELSVTGDVIAGSGATTTIFVNSTSATQGTCVQMQAPNGTLYRLYVSNAGTLTTEAGDCQ